MKSMAVSLLVLVLMFLINLVAIFISPAYKAKVQELIGTRSKTASLASIVEDPAYKEDVDQIRETIEQLTIGLNAITQTGVTSSLSASSGSITGEIESKLPVTISAETPKPKEFPLSIPLQAKLMPDVFVKKVDNKGIFDIKIYSNLDYSTYRDEKNKMNIYAFADSYPVILANLKLASNVYSVKETDSFFEASFFLNPTNSRDTTVRFVTALDGKAYGFEVSKTFYPRLKKLLTHK